MQTIKLSNNFFSGKIPPEFFNWVFWSHWWGDCIKDNLIDYTKESLPGPVFEVRAEDGQILNSNYIYASNKYTVLYQWTLRDDHNSLSEYNKQLKRIASEFGKEVSIISWVNTVYDNKEEAISFAVETSLPGKFFISDNNSYFNDSFFDTSSLINTIGTKACYPGSFLTSITVVDQTGKIVLSDWLQPEYHPLMGDINKDKLYTWIKGMLVNELPDNKYHSSDYSRDGQITQIQNSNNSEGPNLIIIGDGFSDRLQGKFDDYAEKSINAFFSEEPYSSYKEVFTIVR